MGIAGSSINPEFFEEYLGMRVESVDEVEIIRRMENHLIKGKFFMVDRIFGFM
jgi:L-fucose isomerase